MFLILFTLISCLIPLMIYFFPLIIYRYRCPYCPSKLIKKNESLIHIKKHFFEKNDLTKLLYFANNFDTNLVKPIITAFCPLCNKSIHDLEIHINKHMDDVTMTRNIDEFKKIKNWIIKLEKFNMLPYNTKLFFDIIFEENFTCENI
jgi:hypothetical protein